MRMRPEKAQRLEQVARQYYEQGKTQNEIAQQLGVSRPMVSRMLQEARDAGIVEIRIHSLNPGESALLREAGEAFGIEGGILIPDHPGDTILNESLASAAIDYLEALGGERLGLGWGHLIGTLVSLLERREPAPHVIKYVCPMVGNSGVSIRNYHSNENVRILSTQLMATPCYLHTPAFAETYQELELITQTSHYQTVYQQWQQLDVALVNIGNHPSTPDFASSARFGSLLAERGAVGRLVAYYFNERGEVIYSPGDYAVQIPLDLLGRCPHVVGVCSASTSAKALGGALRTGLIRHIIARERLLEEVMESIQ